MTHKEVMIAARTEALERIQRYGRNGATSKKKTHSWDFHLVVWLEGLEGCDKIATGAA